MISSHSNRNWGFKQNTMIQIIKTLWLSSLYYAGHIWMNRNNIQDINSLFYKIIKSTVGAVFNTRQSLVAMMLGLPPLCSVNKINKVKHYLKINMTSLKEDRLRDLIKKELQKKQMNEVHHSTRQVFQFLKWKLRYYPNGLTENDVQIIQSTHLVEFFSLSPKACKYTKDIMNKYQEFIWQ